MLEREGTLRELISAAEEQVRWLTHDLDNLDEDMWEIQDYESIEYQALAEKYDELKADLYANEELVADYSTELRELMEEVAEYYAGEAANA
jgi:hypothetical protein